MANISEAVRETTKTVVASARHVRIDRSAIEELGREWKWKPVHWSSRAPVPIEQLRIDRRVAMAFIFNTISFSYWANTKWRIQRAGTTLDGTWALLSRLYDAMQEDAEFHHPERLAVLRTADLESILGGTSPMPMLSQRTDMLRELGRTLLSHYEGKYAEVLRSSSGNAQVLLTQLVANFTIFDDTSTFRGKAVYFYKRAQLLCADLCHMSAYDGLSIEGLETLTACADYKLPQILRKLRILSYSDELARNVNELKTIEAGSEFEVEIRASTIQAVEVLKSEILAKSTTITSAELNDYLWLEAQRCSSDDLPYHRTRTTAY